MISISFFRWWFSSKANLQSISPPLCSPEPRRFHRDGNRFRQPSSFAAPPRHFLTPTHQPNVVHLCLLPPPWFARTSNCRCPHLIHDVPCHRSTTTTPKDPPAGLELADPQLYQWIHKQVDPNLISMVCYQALWWYCYLVCFYPMWIQNLFSLWIRNHLCASSSSCEFCSCSCSCSRFLICGWMPMSQPGHNALGNCILFCYCFLDSSQSCYPLIEQLNLLNP